MDKKMLEEAYQEAAKDKDRLTEIEAWAITEIEGWDSIQFQ